MKGKLETNVGVATLIVQHTRGGLSRLHVGVKRSTFLSDQILSSITEPFLPLILIYFASTGREVPTVDVMNKPVALRPGANEAYPREATAYEIANLPHVADKVPIIVWLVAFTGAAQRFAFYGTTVPWQNYLQNPPGNPDLPGALGFGQSKATIINNAFLLLSYLAPLPIALISDSWLGRYRTLFLSFVYVPPYFVSEDINLILRSVFLVGEVVLLATSLPSVMPPVPNKDNRTTLAGFITALILIALGQGGTSVIFPFLGEAI